MVIKSIILALLMVSVTSFASDATIGSLKQQSAVPKQILQSVPLMQNKAPKRDNPADVVYFEDFEEGADDWTTTDWTNRALAWGKSDLHSVDGLNWWCGDTLTGYEEEYVGYENTWLQYLDTPVLDLSEAGDNLSLTFEALWLLEDPRRVPPPAPYDGWDGWNVQISTNGGESFSPIRPQSPEYTAERVSAAERWWRQDEFPGWVFHSGEWEAVQDTTPEPAWVECTFDLSNFRQDNVVIRFVLVSDRAVAAPFNYYLRNSGVFLDNIIIADDNDVFLFNNADDDPIPAEMTPTKHSGFGNHWALTDRTAHSGGYSMRNQDEYYNLNNSLDSPVISIPDGRSAYFQFWVYADLPGAEHEGDPALKDFYQIFVSNNGGNSWVYITHDYNRPSAGGDDWTHYQPGIPFSGNLDLDLTEYAGQDVQLRWLFITDNTHTGGYGNGLHIDDVEVISDDNVNYDAAIENLILPYPNSVGFRATPFRADLVNHGLRDIESVSCTWGWTDGYSGRNYPIPQQRLNSGVRAPLQLTDYLNAQIRGWTPTVFGEFTVFSKSLYNGDLDVSNDSLGLSAVRVMPNNIFELGYDTRRVERGFLFNQGDGPLVRFSPQSANLENYTIGAVAFMFNGNQEGAVDARVRILAENNTANPGEEIYSQMISVPADSCYPNSYTLSLTDVEALRNISGDVWVWLELMSDNNRPMILGADSIFIQDRFYMHDGNNTAVAESEFQIHLIITSDVELESRLVVQRNTINFGDRMLNQEHVQPLIVFSTGLSDVIVNDIVSNSEAFMVQWSGEETTLEFGKTLRANILFAPETEELQIGGVTVTYNGDQTIEVDILGTGNSISENEMLRPVNFGLSPAFPNPFNSRSVLNFSLDKQDNISLNLYDISGRLVQELLSGSYAMGSHTVELNASALPAGIYFVKLHSSGRTSTQKIALVK